MKRTRLTPQVRKDQLLTVALSLAAVHGYARLTRDQIAAGAGVSAGLVSQSFGTMTNLRRDIVRAAVRTENLPVLGQALAAIDAHARSAPDALKLRALNSLMT